MMKRKLYKERRRSTMSNEDQESYTSINEIKPALVGIKPLALGPVYCGVTLEAARALEANSAPNRNIKNNVVSSYREAYRNGMWDEYATTSPIMITEDGRLAAGQHRIRMQVKEQIPYMVHLVLNHASAQQIALQDTNANRSFRDKVQQVMNGSTDGIPKIPLISERTFIAAVKILDNESFFQANPGTKGFPTKDCSQIADLVSKYQPIFEKISSKFVEDATTPVYKCSYIVAALVYAYETKTFSSSKLDDIVKRSNYCDQDAALSKLGSIFYKRIGGSNPKTQYEYFKETFNFLKTL